MKPSNFHYEVFCINMKCPDSLFGHINPIRLQLSEDNLLANHACPNCGMGLVSSVDIEMSQYLAAAGIYTNGKGYITLKR
jgi:hypothetical protein